MAPLPNSMPLVLDAMEWGPQLSSTTVAISHFLSGFISHGQPSPVGTWIMGVPKSLFGIVFPVQIAKPFIPGLLSPTRMTATLSFCSLLHQRGRL